MQVTFSLRRAERCAVSDPQAWIAPVHQVTIMRGSRLLSFFSACVVLLIAVPHGAFAQQQERRIALVIGNAAYAKAPLSTAANDGGLVAQTLQAAGFDVSGARDLDGDTLRGAFRDFMKKAEDAAPIR